MAYCLLCTLLFIIFCSPAFTASFASDRKDKDIATLMPYKPREHCSLFVDFLYFKAVADSLQSTQKVPQKIPNYKPKTVVLDQKFKWDPGFRIGFTYHIPYGEWDITSSWMRFYSDHTHRHNSKPDYGLLATLALPVYAASGNALVEHVISRWNVRLNAFDFNFSKNLLFNHFSLRPIGGAKGVVLNQSMHVHYEDYLIEFPTVTTPHKVFAKNPYWGVGPLVGAEMRFLIPGGFSLFFNGSIAALIGNFTIKTVYRDFTNTPQNAKLTINDSPLRVSVFEQMQAGLNKKFKFRGFSIDFAAGWEVEVWGNQMRMDWFKGFIEAPQGSDLTLYGFFARGVVSF